MVQSVKLGRGQILNLLTKYIQFVVQTLYNCETGFMSVAWQVRSHGFYFMSKFLHRRELDITFDTFLCTSDNFTSLSSPSQDTLHTFLPSANPAVFCHSLYTSFSHLPASSSLGPPECQLRYPFHREVSSLALSLKQLYSYKKVITSPPLPLTWLIYWHPACANDVK